MAAGEDEPQSVVGHDVRGLGECQRIGVGTVLQLVVDEERQDAAPVHLAPDDVARPVGRDRREPGTRTVRHTGRRPRLERLGVGVLGALLGEVEVARDLTVAVKVAGNSGTWPLDCATGLRLAS